MSDLLPPPRLTEEALSDLDDEEPRAVPRCGGVCASARRLGLFCSPDIAATEPITTDANLRMADGNPQTAISDHLSSRVIGGGENHKATFRQAKVV